MSSSQITSLSAGGTFSLATQPRVLRSGVHEVVRRGWYTREGASRTDYICHVRLTVLVGTEGKARALYISNYMKRKVLIFYDCLYLYNILQ